MKGLRMKLPQLTSRKWGRPVHIGFSLSALAIAFVSVATAVAFSTNGPSQVASLSGASHDMFDELQIQLSASGFTPNEVQHGAGTFGIAVDNTGVSGEYTLRLKAADGTVVKEVEVQKGSTAWTITLATGEYVLTEASHPEWSCSITVQ